MIELPKIFKERVREMLGDENVGHFFASYNNEAARGINLRIGAGSDTTRTDLISVPWCEKTGRYYTDADERPSKTIAYHAGLFYIQEPSAMCPAEVLGVSPGQKVLDICAAPGGKSVQIAGKLNGEGLLVSNDASASRSRALVKNLERAGVTNAIVLVEQPKKLATRFPQYFDRILVDAPCSGEGMFRRDHDAIKAYTANKPEACAAIQSEILRRAATMLKPGGRMVYSTCTFNRLENEDVIETFLKTHNHFSLLKIDHALLGIQAGFDLSGKTARIWPHLARGEGHFVALLEKIKDKTLGETFFEKKVSPKPPSKKLCIGDLGDFLDFLREFLVGFREGEFVLNGSDLFLQPFAVDLSGLRVARSGWFLGEIAKNRFVPGQALAMGLRREQSRFSVELSEADADKYLRGESLYFDGVMEGKPWVLVCFEGHPLGWARLVQGRLKNYLAKGWVKREK